MFVLLVRTLLSSLQKVWLGTSNDANGTGLRIEFRSSHCNLHLGCGVGLRVVLEINGCYLVANDIIHHRRYVNLWMGLGDFNSVFKACRTVTFDLELFCVGVADSAILSHIDDLGEELCSWSLGVNNGESVHGDQDLVALTMDSD